MIRHSPFAIRHSPFAIRHSPFDIRHSPFGTRHPASGIVGVVAVVALLINALSLSASQLWVCPDSSYYIALAGGLAERFDFTNELFLIRPPGYPLMLAVIFRLFGARSPVAILVVQHAMVVGTAVLTALIGWHLTRRRTVTLLAGVMCACSLQLLAFANVIITEVPYTFVFVLGVYFLVRYHCGGGGRFLACASFMSGISYLIRPTGLSLVAVCVAAAVHRTLSARAKARGSEGDALSARGKARGSEGDALSARAKARGSEGDALSARAKAAPSSVLSITSTGATRNGTGCGPGRNEWRRRSMIEVALAMAPALAAVLPMMVLNRIVHGTDLSGPCANLALYHRLLAMDGLDSTNSRALADIRSVVKVAVERGDIPPHADYRQWGPVWHAYEAVRNIPLVESSRIMGRAARDLLIENPGTVFRRTVRYAYWMLMVPDSFYRFHPGGAPGTVTPRGESRRDAEADIFDVSTYEPMLRPWIEPYRRYLPLQDQPGITSPAWRGLARWFYTHVENGRPLLGLGESLYEEFTWLCLAGVAISLLRRERATWVLVTGVIFLQIASSAFLAGPTPRYAVPVKPLLLLYAALPPMALADVFRASNALLKTH